GKRRGRPRKEQAQLLCIHHAQAMERMWKPEEQTQQRWKLVQSLRKQGKKDVRAELVKRGVPPSDIKALTVPNVTAESWLAHSYASSSRSGISQRTARNALRKFEKVMRFRIVRD